jgi:hypothetical protein
MYGVLTATLSLSYLAIVLTLSFTHLRPSHPLPSTSSRQQKLATLLESYILLWILTLISTITVGQLSAGTTYFITFWHLCLLVGTVVGLFEAYLRARGGAGKSDVGPGNSADTDYAEDPQRILVRGVRYDANGTGTGARIYEGGEEVRVRDEHGEGAIVETEPTEITPLITQQRQRSRSRASGESDERKSENRDELLWWLIQMLIVVPIPLLLISQIGLLILTSLNQTLIDGSKASTGKSSFLAREKHLNSLIF